MCSEFSRIGDMWDPDQKEKDPGTQDPKADCIELLKTSPEFRAEMGICLNEDGSYGISDLPRIQGFAEDVKVVLREFLKANGKKKPVENAWPGMTTKIREGLDSLYEKIDRLATEAPPRKHFSQSPRLQPK